MPSRKISDYLKIQYANDPNSIRHNGYLIPAGYFLTDDGTITKPQSKYGNNMWDALYNLPVDERIELRKVYNDINRLTQYN